MKIHEYNEMMSWLTRPGMRTGGTIGGGTIQGQNMGYRTGFAAPRKIKVNDEKLIAEWRKSLDGKNPKAWRNFLENKFNAKTADSLRHRIRKNFPNFDVDEYKTKVNEKRLNFVKKLIAEHNASDKFLYDREIIYKKLGEAGLTGGTKLDRATGVNAQIYNLLETLEPMETKVTKAFDKIINEDLKIYKPKNIAKTKGTYGLLKQMIADIVSPKGGSRHYQVGANAIAQALNKHEPYLKIKDDIDYFDKYQSSSFRGKNFSEGFNYSKYTRGGLQLKNLRDFSGGFARPESQIYSFAARHAFLNNKLNTSSQVQFYKLRKDGSKGALIKFNDLPKDSKTFARALDSDKYGFDYKGQFFNKDNLRTKGFKSGLFDEVYALTKKGGTLVPDPKNPKKQIALKTLLRDAGDKLTIGHNDAIGGVKSSPFNSLRIEGGKLNIALFNAYDKIKNKQLRKLILNDLATKFPSINLEGEAYEKAFINEQSDIVKNISKQTDSLTPYRAAGQKVIKDLGKDFFKQSKPFQQEAMRVAGIKSTDDVQTIINKINKAPLPNRIKKPLIAAVYAGGVITGADLMTGSVEAAEPGQMPQGSPGQLSEDEGLSLQDKAALGTVAVAGAKPAWKYALKPALKTIAAPSAGLGIAGWSFVDNFNASKADTEEGKVYDALTTGYKFGEKEIEMPGSAVGTELLFPEVMKQGAKTLGIEFSKQGGKTALAALGRFALNPIGKAASIMTPTGLTLNAAAVAKQYYDFAKDEISKAEQMKPEDRKAYNEMLMDETYSSDAGDYYTSQDVLDKYNQGGRVGFDKGSTGFSGTGDEWRAQNPTREEILAGVEPNFNLLDYIKPRASLIKSSETPVEGIDVDMEDRMMGVSGEYSGDKFYVGGDLQKGHVKVNVQEDGKTIYVDSMPKDDLQKLYLGLGEKRGDHVEVGTDGRGNYTLNIKKSFAKGGRVGFGKGSPKDPSKRLFLKGVTALAALPLVGRFFKVGKLLERASTYTGPAIEKIKGMPEWFPGLVKKLWNEGDDVTKQVAITERQIVKRGTLESGDDIDLIYHADTGDVSINVTPKKGTDGTSSGAFNKEYELNYTKGQADEMTKGKKPPDEFQVTETEPVRTGHPEDPDWDWDGIDTTVDDAITDLTEIEAFSKSKSVKQIHKKKGTKPKDVNPEVEYPEYDYDID